MKRGTKKKEEKEKKEDDMVDYYILRITREAAVDRVERKNLVLGAEVVICLVLHWRQQGKNLVSRSGGVRMTVRHVNINANRKIQ
jgi:hypothetical protein